MTWVVRMWEGSRKVFAGRVVNLPDLVASLKIVAGELDLRVEVEERAESLADYDDEIPQ